MWYKVVYGIRLMAWQVDGVYKVWCEKIWVRRLLVRVQGERKEPKDWDGNSFLSMREEEKKIGGDFCAPMNPFLFPL